ncbi:phosphonate metabolism protein/1,5-bisphosphokinase (PRPP-forming) PhnN [Aureimonas mangrovi]|uniref:phosphonate metabolism protein/1,5-bisphosphokinase (PRPP-forming) PhnN n=1 Tax=Aureimonas mangrovi TaxID=2758041 RepID=UPI00163DB3A2|nr:phosphonate metabolism protein/1,5-bisphosphokinase (PRPP-forming) PhnN [Aureimonas mangrovi]
MSPEPRPQDADSPAAGCLVAVVGPSGAGKDTLIAGAIAELAGEDWVRFARRVVTRPAHAASEDHDSLDDDAFARAEAAGTFALTWRAHGLRYGLPSAIVSEVHSGRVVVANLSRRALPAAAASFERISVVEITAEPEVLVARILARGREDEAAARRRVARRVDVILPERCCCVQRIDNSGGIEEALGAFVRHLRQAGGQG